MNRKVNIFTGIASGLGVVCLSVIVAYSYQNKSGHTGAYPYSALAVFCPLMILGMYNLDSNRGAGAPKRYGWASVVVGFLGIVILVYLDMSNTLLNYGVWADRLGP